MITAHPHEGPTKLKGLIHEKDREQDQAEESKKLLYDFSIISVISRSSDNSQTCSNSHAAYVSLPETDK